MEEEASGPDPRVDAWLSGPLFVSQPVLQCTTVHCKPRCIQWIEAMDVKFGIHNGNFNT